MELIFLGTGGAWGLPEHQCPCATCRHLRQIGEHRGRAGLWLAAGANILFDPGPDLRSQLMREDLPRPDAVLITHEHLDHMGGLDDLLCYRRNLPPMDWRPIPVYASPAAWEQIEPRFGYLLGSLLEKRLAVPGQELAGEPFGGDMSCLPVKVDHGPFPKGALGYRLAPRENGRAVSIGYTGDMVGPVEPDAFAGLDVLVLQSHFLNEPRVNRANHLSLQRALEHLARWRPGEVYFTHISCQDTIPGDETANAILKKHPPTEPLRDPQGHPYPVPRDQQSWEIITRAVLDHHHLAMPSRVAYDGLRVLL